MARRGDLKTLDRVSWRKPTSDTMVVERPLVGETGARGGCHWFLGITRTGTEITAAVLCIILSGWALGSSH